MTEDKCEYVGGCKKADSHCLEGKKFECNIYSQVRAIDADLESMQNDGIVEKSPAAFQRYNELRAKRDQLLG